MFVLLNESLYCWHKVLCVVCVVCVCLCCVVCLVCMYLCACALCVSLYACAVCVCACVYVCVCVVCVTCTCFRHSFNHSAEIFTLYNGDFDVHLYHSSGAVCGRKHWYIHLETGPSVYLHLFSSKVAYHSCFLITFHVPLLYLSCYVYM